MTPSRGFQLLRSGMGGVEVVAANSAHAFGRHTHDQFGIGLIERGAQKSASGRGASAPPSSPVWSPPASAWTTIPPPRLRSLPWRPRPA